MIQLLISNPPDGMNKDQLFDNEQHLLNWLDIQNQTGKFENVSWDGTQLKKGDETIAVKL